MGKTIEASRRRAAVEAVRHEVDVLERMIADRERAIDLLATVVREYVNKHAGCTPDEACHESVQRMRMALNMTTELI